MLCCILCDDDDDDNDDGDVSFRAKSVGMPGRGHEEMLLSWLLAIWALRKCDGDRARAVRADRNIERLHVESGSGLSLAGLAGGGLAPRRSGTCTCRRRESVSGGGVDR